MKDGAGLTASKWTAGLLLLLLPLLLLLVLLPPLLLLLLLLLLLFLLLLPSLTGSASRLAGSRTRTSPRGV